MNPHLIFVPILAHFTLVIFLYTLLFRRKMAALKSKEVNLKETSLNCKAWPDEAVLKCSNNLDNQFQAPVLFYALCFVLAAIGGVSQGTLILAWAFVLSRYLHSSIHVGKNYVPHRMKAFAFGVFSLVGLASFAAYRLWDLLGKDSPLY